MRRITEIDGDVALDGMVKRPSEWHNRSRSSEIQNRPLPVQATRASSKALSCSSGDLTLFMNAFG